MKIKKKSQVSWYMPVIPVTLQVGELRPEGSPGKNSRPCPKNNYEEAPSSNSCTAKKPQNLKTN